MLDAIDAIAINMRARLCIPRVVRRERNSPLRCGLFPRPLCLGLTTLNVLFQGSVTVLYFGLEQVRNFRRKGRHYAIGRNAYLRGTSLLVHHHLLVIFEASGLALACDVDLTGRTPGI